MTGRWTAGLLALAAIASACSSSAESAIPVPGDASSPAASLPAASDPIATDPDATDSAAPTTASENDDAPTTTGTESTTTTSTLPPTTSTSSTTSTTSTLPPTTTTVPPLDVYDPACVVEVAPGDSLSLIADRFDDETVHPQALIIENELEGETIDAGQLLDVCVENGLNDIDGEQRTEQNAALAVRRQQEKLNELFANTGIRELLVDGVSGPVTRQRICAARLALGLTVSTADLEPGGEEEAAIMAAPELPTPFTTAALSDRWVLIDRTCQIMFVGERERTLFVFPTSTGEPGHETRSQDRSRAFRYDPASDNGGWHNSSTYPVAIDNPLNGNMYRPIYFDGGQAIHGANNVPRSPASKGCARLRVEDQDQLVAWLGLADRTSATWSENTIAMTVNVQGEWVAR